ncbi:DUF2530 domain-containing protein [Thermobifida halotolerans]|uniref:DUF2530 domain-containing protein n=1 Tax=Thermobifida halotolerans TaxID=483545 RepID=A0A399G1U1_9ACTN|nr:DUF2530 domain-containing protein [Thermobifida halotolerans]UOE19298.1 DUF2530 domain-containing protein [Thermobifida halotolerans]
MRKPRKPDPEVHESDYRVPAAVGTAAWTVALIVLLVRGDRLPADDRWWIWVCVTGIALGVFGFFYIPRLLRRRAEAEERRRDRHSAGLPAGSTALPGPDRQEPRKEARGEVSEQPRH